MLFGTELIYHFQGKTISSSINIFGMFCEPYCCKYLYAKNNMKRQKNHCTAFCDGEYSLSKPARFIERIRRYLRLLIS